MSQVDRHRESPHTTGDSFDVTPRLSVGRRKRRLEFTNDWDGSAQLFVDHKSKDSHHGGTSVVQFDGTLSEFGLRSEGVPSEVEGSVSEVSGEFSFSGNILHDSKLKSSNEGNDLSESGRRDGIRSEKGGGSVRVRGEGVSGQVNVSGKVDSGTGGDLSEEGKHTDTSVLDLDVSETVELFLVTVLNESQGIEESERRLGSEGIFECLEGGGGSLLLNRGKCSGGGDEGGKDGGLHCVCLFVCLFACLNCLSNRIVRLVCRDRKRRKFLVTRTFSHR
mmetsp:Transcript_22085/g.61438  ORF Transcript_22085/g.61438 Transcript_22085/m.61438 type:complete len:277 (-) Transcript_22085:610-1440(-)